MPGLHVATISLLPVSSVGTILDKDKASSKAMMTASSELRIIEDIAIPNTTGNPTIREYLELEAASSFTLKYIGQTFVVTEEKLAVAPEPIEELALFEYIADEAIVAGNVVSQSSTANRVKKAKASDASRMPAIGVAFASQPLAGSSVLVILIGTTGVTKDAAFTIKKPVFVSEMTAGNATTTEPSAVGSQLQIIGVSKNLTDLTLQVSHIITTISAEI
jgi:hypothetical protein